MKFSQFPGLMSYNTVLGALCRQKKTGSTICCGYHWAIPENIHAIPRTAFWNSECKGGSLNWKSDGMGGYLRLELWGHGGFLDLEFPQDRQECIPWKHLFHGLYQFANKARIDNTANNCRSGMQDAILIFEACGIGSNSWPWRLQFKMAEMQIHSNELECRPSQVISSQVYKGVSQ